MDTHESVPHHDISEIFSILEADSTGSYIHVHVHVCYNA